MEAVLLFESGRLDLVLASSWDCLQVLVVKHLPAVGTEAVVWRLGLLRLGYGVVLDLCGNALRTLFVVLTLRCAEAPGGRRSSRLVVELVLAWAWHQLVLPLLELVVV